MPKILDNKIIVLTRHPEQSKEAILKLEKNGASVISFPTIKIVPTENHEEFDTAINTFNTFDYVVFTSANAVKHFVIRLDQIQKRLNFDKTTVVAVGEKTAAACNRYQISVDIVPKDFSAKGIAEELSQSDITGKKFFIPCSSIARDELPKRLGKMGAAITRLPIYNTIVPDGSETDKPVEVILNSKPDIFIFTSPSTFHNFVTILNLADPEDYFKGRTVAAIGPTTESAIRAKGVTVQITPSKNTMSSLIDSVLNFYPIPDKIGRKKTSRKGAKNAKNLNV